MDRLLSLLVLGVAGFIAWRQGWLDKLSPIGSARASTGGGLAIDFSNLFSMPASSSSSGRYLPPSGALPFLAAIRAAEKSNGIPGDLLVRLLDQESHYRPDVITGRVSSRVGAKGIAQVMPATAAGPGYGVPPLSNPLDPFMSIAWAGRYLAALKSKFGSWQWALAAYNFGPGNVANGSAWPSETVNYVASITRDVPVA